jgi:hypothetical protein
MTERFDAAYYRRYYGSRPVHTRQRIALLAKGVFSFAAWWRVPIRSVLEVGAGKAYWRDWLEETHTRVSYHGIDASEYACRRYRHERADLATWAPSRSYDLVVCQSVLQYLDDSSAAKGMETLADACRGLLYFDVPTIADRDNVIDASSTDLDVHWRTGAWYRKRLSVGFTEIGAGIWLSKKSTAVFWELERRR